LSIDLSARAHLFQILRSQAPSALILPSMYFHKNYSQY
jgi:hypothetical protein